MNAAQRFGINPKIGVVAREGGVSFLLIFGPAMVETAEKRPTPPLYIARWMMFPDGLVNSKRELEKGTDPSFPKPL